MQKITINGHGFEYIRGYIEDAENIPVEELMEGDGISVTSICCNYNAFGFGGSYSKFYNDTTKELYKTSFAFSGPTHTWTAYAKMFPTAYLKPWAISMPCGSLFFSKELAVSYAETTTSHIGRICSWIQSKDEKKKG